MSSLTLQLDGDALREATVQAMLGVLTPEVKSQMLEKAIQAMLKPSTNSWEKNKSPIEIAFEQAVDKVAREEAIRIVSEDPVLCDRIRELMRSTADKVLNADQEKLAQRMADSFVSSLRRD